MSGVSFNEFDSVGICVEFNCVFVGVDDKGMVGASARGGVEVAVCGEGVTTAVFTIVSAGGYRNWGGREGDIVESECG